MAGLKNEGVSTESSNDKQLMAMDIHRGIGCSYMYEVECLTQLDRIGFLMEDRRTDELLSNIHDGGARPLDSDVNRAVRY